MSFGYSVGDFIAGANLSYRLIKALSETQGASLEYQAAIAEISSLQQTFLQVSQMRASNTLSQATINMAEVIVMSSMELIGAWLTKTQKYREQLCGRRSNSKASASWQKMGWVLFKKEELRQLRDELHLKLSHISLLFSTAHIHAKIPASVAKYEVGDFDKLSEAPQIHDLESEEKISISEPMEAPLKESAGTLSQEIDLERRLQAIEKLMIAQRSNFERGQEENATTKAAESTAQQTEDVSRRAAEKAAIEYERKAREEREAIGRWEFEQAKKRKENELEKAKQKMAEEEARLSAQAAIAKAEEMAKEKVAKARAEADAAIATAKKEAAETIAAAMKATEHLQDNHKFPESRQRPIRFKDAVGRKFSFPFHLCSTWAGIESLIQQAFMNVDILGPHVLEGHYDLMGPNGEIILPQVWESVIEPDWPVSMHMWPMPEGAEPEHSAGTKTGRKEFSSRESARHGHNQAKAMMAERQDDHSQFGDSSSSTFVASEQEDPEYAPPHNPTASPSPAKVPGSQEPGVPHETSEGFRKPRRRGPRRRKPKGTQRGPEDTLDIDASAV